MSKRNKQVDAYIAKSADFAKPILQHLRELVHEACPDVEESIKWSFPNFDYKGILCSMAAFKQHCSFGFWKATMMEEYAKKLSPFGQSGMGNFGRLTSLKDLPPDKLIIQYIEEACKLNDLGIKVKKPKAAEKKPLVVPGYFKKAVAASKKAQATFNSFSYSNKKDYVEWVTEAKTEPTRKKRLETTVKWLAEGKIRNWKYMK